MNLECFVDFAQTEAFYTTFNICVVKIFASLVIMLFALVPFLYMCFVLMLYDDLSGIFKSDSFTIPFNLQLVSSSQVVKCTMLSWQSVEDGVGQSACHEHIITKILQKDN